MTQTRTRFSPSPTGLIHLGNIRAALFSYLLALKNNGSFILRIEDTDTARSEAHFVEQLQADLNWLGIDWQEGPVVGGAHGPYWQSEPQEIYNRYYAELKSKNLIYPCFCSDQDLLLMRKLQLSQGKAPRYAGTCKKLTENEVAKRIASGQKPAWRFIVPETGAIEFIDTIKGPQRFLCHDMGDFIVRRADGTAPFLFCNAVDDAMMAITHVIRGEDHVANTPRQMLILQSLALSTPRYGHFSMIVGQDGAPLSKRNGSASISDLRKQGYLPNAIVNYMSRLGHACDTQALCNLTQLAYYFNLEKISHSPTRFDPAQLLYWQKAATAALDVSVWWEWVGGELKSRIPADKVNLFVESVRNNILFPVDAVDWVARLFNDTLTLDEEAIAVLRAAGAAFFAAAKTVVEQHGAELNAITQGLKAQLGVSGKALFMPLRVALTGVHDGPQLAPLLHLLGKEMMIKRLQQAEKRC